jgi:two-component system NarL family response regulator
MARAGESAPRRLRVLAADDHDLFRSGLCSLLSERGFDVVAEVADGQSAVERAGQLQPDVVIMELDLPRLSGAQAAPRIAEVAPGARLIAFTISVDESTVVEAVEAGFHGYLLKDAPVEEIVEAVKTVAAGEAPISSQVGTVLLRRLREASPPKGADTAADLTAREREILGLIATGRSNDEIADLLCISPRTAKNHISSILWKLGVDNRIQAAVHAVRRGLV